MISYAQNFEDVLLMRALKDVGYGFYIDIGANHPIIDSVSLAFYEKGWRGIHVEPMPEFANLLRERRPDEQVLEVAVSTNAKPLELVSFEGTGLTTAVKEHAARHIESGLKSAQIKVKTITLDRLFETYVNGEVHWVKIDVEGMEKDVLDSWRESPVRPWVLVVESTLPNLQIQSFEDWEPLLVEKGYEFAYFDGLNRYYVHELHNDLAMHLAVQPNVFDRIQFPRTSGFVRHLATELHDLSNATSALREQLNGQTRLFSESLRVALDAQSAEASDNRIRLDAELVAAKAEINTTHARLREALGERDAALIDSRDAHLRLQAALLERDAAFSEINETHVRLRDALEKLDGAYVEIRDTHLRLQAALQAHEDAIQAGEAREMELLAEANEAKTVLAAERAEKVALRDKIDRVRRNTEHARAALLGEIAALRQARDEETIARHHQLNQLANEFRATLSWRLTAPVRGVSSLARSALTAGNGAARRMAHAALGLIRRYPWMKQPVLAAVSVSPSLRNSLVAYGQRHAPPLAAPPRVSDRFMLSPDPAIVAAWTAELNRQGAPKNSGRAA